MEGVDLLGGQTLKSVVAASAIALSSRKNTPQTTSSERGGHFLEKGPQSPAQAQSVPPVYIQSWKMPTEKNSTVMLMAPLPVRSVLCSEP